MATLQVRNGSYRVLFCYAHRRHSYTLGQISSKEADLAASNIDRLLLRLEQGLLKVPQSVDIVTFLKNDGQIEVAPEAPRPQVTLKQLHDRYEKAHGNGVMEESSLKSWSIHYKHLLKTLGSHFCVQSLNLTNLQEHIDARRTKKGIHGKRLSTATLKKEIGSLRAAWNWGLTVGAVEGQFPGKGLLYPKTDEKPPFQTLMEIERQIELGGLTPVQERGLWDCLFLTLEDIQNLLDSVDKQAEHGFIYPMVCLAAHTGARRSEMLRLRWHDVDFVSSTVLLHEKKRSRSKRTTRRVSLSPFLEKGGKQRRIPVRSGLQELLLAYLGETGLRDAPKDTPLFRSACGRTGSLSDRAITGLDIYRMMKRRLADAQLPRHLVPHSIRACVVTDLLTQGLPLEDVQVLVGHADPRTTRLYDRRKRLVSRNLVERISV